MAINRVRSLKLEVLAEGGGQTDTDVNETNIGEDYLDANGFAVQVSGATATNSDATTYVSRPSASQLAFTDQASGTLTLEQLMTSVIGKPGYHGSQLDIIHFLADGGPGDGFASGMFRQVVSTGQLPQSITWWTSTSMTSKIYSVAYTYTGALVATQTQTLYSNNTAIRTVTDTYNYATSVFAPTITRVWS